MQSNLILSAVLGVSCLLLPVLSQAEQSATFAARNSALEQRASERQQAQQASERAASTTKQAEAQTTRDS